MTKGLVGVSVALCLMTLVLVACVYGARAFLADEVQTPPPPRRLSMEERLRAIPNETTAITRGATPSRHVTSTAQRDPGATRRTDLESMPSVNGGSKHARRVNYTSGPRTVPAVEQIDGNGAVYVVPQPTPRPGPAPAPRVVRYAPPRGAVQRGDHYAGHYAGQSGGGVVYVQPGGQGYHPAQAYPRAQSQGQPRYAGNAGSYQRQATGYHAAPAPAAGSTQAMAVGPGGQPIYGDVRGVPTPASAPVETYTGFFDDINAADTISAAQSLQSMAEKVDLKLPSIQDDSGLVAPPEGAAPSVPATIPISGRIGYQKVTDAPTDEMPSQYYSENLVGNLIVRRFVLPPILPKKLDPPPPSLDTAIVGGDAPKTEVKVNALSWERTDYGKSSDDTDSVVDYFYSDIAISRPMGPFQLHVSLPFSRMVVSKGQLKDQFLNNTRFGGVVAPTFAYRAKPCDCVPIDFDFGMNLFHFRLYSSAPYKKWAGQSGMGAFTSMGKSIGPLTFKFALTWQHSLDEETGDETDDNAAMPSGADLVRFEVHTGFKMGDDMALNMRYFWNKVNGGASARDEWQRFGFAFSKLMCKDKAMLTAELEVPIDFKGDYGVFGELSFILKF